MPDISRRGFLGTAAVACLSGLGLLTGCAGKGAGSDGGSSAGSSKKSSRKTTADGTVTKDADVAKLSTFLFDTVIEIQAACDQDLMDKINDRMQYFENKFSRTVEGSDIWNINAAKGKPVEVAKETADVITQGLKYGKDSGGLFDISIGAVSSLWDFVNAVKPADDKIAEAVKHVDYTKVHVDGTTVTLEDPAAMLDLGGIAKGYITDDLVKMFRAGGCKDAFINLGGNVYVMGNSFDGDEWVVGVQDPNDSSSGAVAKIACSDLSVVTSGLYERGFEQDGTFYYHILDPKTGYPVKTDLESSSVACVSSTMGDAYSTILFLKGHDKALKLLNDDERFEGGVLVDDDGKTTVSDGSAFKLL